MGLLSKFISLGIVISGLYPQLKSLRFNKELPIDAKEPSEEVLLKEYEICQQSVSLNATRYWTIVSIFIPVNTALLGWVVYVISSGDFIISGQINWYFILVLFFSSGMIIILCFLKRWINRVNYNITISYHRMREIESTVGMLKNLTVHWLDNPNEIPNEQRKRISRILHDYVYVPKLQDPSFKWIIMTLILLWVVLFVAALAKVLTQLLIN